MRHIIVFVIIINILDILYALPPNDDHFSDQWHLEQANDRDIDALNAWNISTGDDDVIIAIIDTGVKYVHEDLGGSNWPTTRGNVWINTVEENGINNYDDDNNGYIDDIYGWDFVDTPDEDPTPEEDQGGEDPYPVDIANHGTRTAGIAAAITNNETGVSGIAGGWGPSTPGCKIMILKAGYEFYSRYPDVKGSKFDNDVVVNAFNYATQNGADIINCSFKTNYSSALETAVNNAINAGIIVVVAAGNEANEQTDYLNGRGDCISVAAIEEDDTILIEGFGSNYGSWVDISAPGKDIYTTMNNGGYGTFTGTSAAAPIVSGVIGLMKSVSPSLSSTAIKDIIEYTADDIDSVNSLTYTGKLGAGRINAHKALLAASPATTSGTISSNEIWYGTVTLTGDVTIASGVELEVLPNTTINIPSGYELTSVSGLINLHSGVTISPNIQRVSSGAIYGLYSSFENAVNDGNYGQTIQCPYGVYTLTQNLIIPDGVVLQFADNSTINLASYYIKSQSSGYLDNFADCTINPLNIYSTEGAVRKGQFPTLQNALTNAATGRGVNFGGTRTGDFTLSKRLNMIGYNASSCIDGSLTIDNVTGGYVKLENFHITGNMTANSCYEIW